jgi:hypothetical protein
VSVAFALQVRVPPRADDGVEALALESGLHPELVRRFIRLGLVERGTYPRDGGARLARAARLRRDLGLSYTGAIFACELLARIDALEAQLRARPAPLR